MYLKHHGIKGQKWGVRNGPPYPIEDKVLKKGTKINSVSGIASSNAYKNDGKWKYVFRPEIDWDRSVYKGPFSVFLRNYKRFSNVYEHEFETTKDLLMPTKKERIDEFLKLYDDPKSKKYMAKEMEQVRKMCMDHKIGTEKQQKEFSEFNTKNKPVTPDEKRIAYWLFNHAMEANYAYAMTRTYSKNIAKKYDAMVDDNNQGVYNEAKDPIIIFNASKVLKVVGKNKVKMLFKEEPIGNFVPDSEIVENFKYVQSEMQKKGKNIAI